MNISLKNDYGFFIGGGVGLYVRNQHLKGVVGVDVGSGGVGDNVIIYSYTNHNNHCNLYSLFIYRFVYSFIHQILIIIIYSFSSSFSFLHPSSYIHQLRNLHYRYRIHFSGSSLSAIQIVLCYHGATLP